MSIESISFSLISSDDIILFAVNSELKEKYYMIAVNVWRKRKSGGHLSLVYRFSLLRLC